MKPAPVSTPVELRWQDFDVYGHLHVVAHFAVLEQARNQFFDRVFQPRTTWDYVVVHLEIDFEAELKFFDRTALCAITVAKLGSKSITTLEEIRSVDERVVSAARCVAVPWDRDNHTTRSLTPAEREALQEHRPIGEAE